MVLVYFASRADRRRAGGRRAETVLRGFAGDIALAVAVAAVDFYGAWDEAHNPVQGDPTLKLPLVPWWAYIFVVLAGLALIGRRKWPLASFVGVMAPTFVFTVLGYNDGAPFLAVAVSLYSLATVLNPKPVWLALLVAIAVCEVTIIVFEPFGVTQGPSTVVPWELAAGAGIGFFVASRRAQAARAQERADEEARRGVQEERLRIARELHDVVAHSMATINVQAGVALHLLSEAGEQTGPRKQAVDAMEAVRATSKEALRELRGMVGLLRSSSEGEEPKSPAPRLAEVGDLLEMTAKAGLPAGLRVLGEQRDLSPAVDLAAYRIIQEALTNTLRHAGPARATVTLEYAPECLVVEVSDDGRGALAGPSADTAGAGKGLLGMRERAEALGGTLDAGPLAGGGFRVRAELPTAEGSPSGTERTAPASVPVAL